MSETNGYVPPEAVQRRGEKDENSPEESPRIEQNASRGQLSSESHRHTPEMFPPKETGSTDAAQAASQAGQGDNTNAMNAQKQGDNTTGSLQSDATTRQAEDFNAADEEKLRKVRLELVREQLKEHQSFRPE